MDLGSVIVDALPFGELLLAGASFIAIAAIGFAIHARAAYLRTDELLQRKAELVANLHEGVYRSTLDGHQISANPALVRLNGYETEAEQLAGVKDIGAEWYVDPNRRQQFRETLERDGQVESFVSEIYRHKTRERIWISESARLVRHGSTGKPLYFEGSVHEVTETVRRFQLEERFSKLTRLTPVGLFQMQIVEGMAQSLYVNQRFEQITGVMYEELLENGRALRRYVYPDDLEGYVKSLEDSARNMVSWSCEFRYITPSGEDKWLKVSAEPEVAADGVIFHGYLVDVSERRRHLLERHVWRSLQNRADQSGVLLRQEAFWAAVGRLRPC